MTQPPRIPAHSSSMAATAAGKSESYSPQQMVTALQSFRFGDVCSFDTSAEDLAHTALNQAHALLIALSITAEEDSQLRAVHLRECLDGVGTLVSLAKFALEGLPE